MKVRQGILLVTALLLLFNTGCWDYSDYENLALVSAMGIDFIESTKQVTVSVQYLSVENGSDSEKNQTGNQKTIHQVIKATGFTIADALAKIQQSTQRTLFYAYMDAFVIGGEAARSIMLDILQFAERTPNMRATSSLVVTQGKAVDILSTANPNSSTAIGELIRGLGVQSQKAGSAFPVTIQDFTEKLVISGQEPVAPLITVEYMEEESQGSSENTAEEEGPVAYGKLKKGYHKISGMAVFRGAEFIGSLHALESTGLGYILSENQKPYENVNLSGDNRTEDTAIFRVQSSKSKITVRIENELPIITVDTTVVLAMRKYSQSTATDTLSPETIQMLNEKVSENVRSEMIAVIDKGQHDLKSDIFNFGFEVYRQFPKEWNSSYKQKWRDIFPDIAVEVNVKAEVINTGTSIEEFQDE